MTKISKLRKVSLGLAGALIAATLPLSALAHDGSDQNSDNGDRGIGAFVSSFVHSLRDQGDQDNNNDSDHSDFDLNAKVQGNLFLGTVTKVDGSTVTFTGKNGEEFTMNVDGVKVVRLQGDAFVDATLKVGDKILVGGTADSSNVVTATVVRDLSQNKRNKVQGTVTAVNGDTVTVQTKHNGTQDITTNASTSVVLDNGLPGSLTDIVVGAMIRAIGSWNAAGDVFTALLIKIK